MTVLKVDTDILRSAVQTAKQTNEAITEACNYLNQVVEHNDWVCSERDQINENTVTNRQTAQTIQENSSSFYDAIKQASEDFDEAEQNNITNIGHIDDILSRILPVVVGISGGVSSAPGISSYSDILKSLED